VEIIWDNLNFWWTNKLMIYYLDKSNFSKIEKLLPIRKKLAENIRSDIQKKRIIKEKKKSRTKKCLREPVFSWKIIFFILY